MLAAREDGEVLGRGGGKCFDVAVAIEPSFIVVLPSFILRPVAMDAVDHRLDSRSKAKALMSWRFFSKVFWT